MLAMKLIRDLTAVLVGFVRKLAIKLVAKDQSL